MKEEFKNFKQVDPSSENVEPIGVFSVEEKNNLDTKIPDFNATIQGSLKDNFSQAQNSTDEVSTLEELLIKFPHMPLFTYYYINQLIPATKKKLIDYINKGYVQFLENKIIFSDDNGPITAVQNKPFQRTQEQLEDYLAPQSRSERLSAITIDDEALDKLDGCLDNEDEDDDDGIIPKKSAKEFVFQPISGPDFFADSTEIVEESIGLSGRVYFNTKFNKPSKKGSVLNQIVSLLQSGKKHLASVSSNNNTTMIYPIKQLEHIIEKHGYGLLSPDQLSRIKKSLFTNVFQCKEKEIVLNHNSRFCPEAYAFYALVGGTGNELELRDKPDSDREDLSEDRQVEKLDDIPENYMLKSNPPTGLLLGSKSSIMVYHTTADGVLILPSSPSPLLVTVPIDDQDNVAK